MVMPARTMRLVTPIMRSQTSLLQPRYASLLNPTLSAKQLSPLARRFASSSTTRLASPAATSNASASHDSAGHDGHHNADSEDRSPPHYGLHLHEPSQWHVLGSKVFGQRNSSTQMQASGG